MNTDDFEQHLKHQTLRQVPSAWRAEILAAARAQPATPARRGRTGSSTSFWRLVLARFPVAGGALAAAWLAVIAINLALSGPAVHGPRRAGVPPNRLTIWNLQTAELRQLASGDEPDSPPPKALPPGPRSERRDRSGLGEIRPARPSNTMG